jgi:hypothetical protein
MFGLKYNPSGLSRRSTVTNKEFQFWRNYLIAFSAILALLMKLGSLLSLIQIGFDYCFVAVISVLVDWFLDSVNAIFYTFIDWWLIDFLRNLFEFLGFELQLYAHWKIIFLIMMLKCGSDVFAEMKRRDNVYAALWFGWGLIVTFPASVVSGLVPLDDPNMIPVIAPIVGFVVYGSGQAVWLARYRVPEGRSSGQIFRYYFIRFAVADGIIGVLCLIAAMGMRDAGYPNPNVLAFFLYLLGMAARDLATPAWYVTFKKRDGGTWWQRYIGLATTWTGLHTMSVLTAVFLVMLFNSGLVVLTGNPCQ